MTTALAFIYYAYSSSEQRAEEGEAKSAAKIQAARQQGETDKLELEIQREEQQSKIKSRKENYLRRRGLSLYGRESTKKAGELDPAKTTRRSLLG